MRTLLDKFLRWQRFKKVFKYVPKNSAVCDIGCGKEAYFLKKISNLIKQGIGIDEEVEDYKDSKFQFKKFRISGKIPLESGSCDVVTMMAVLEHLTNPYEVLNECYRILRDGGRLILTTPNSKSKPFLELLARLGLINRGEIADHKRYFRPNELKKTLIDIGFKKANDYFFEFHLNSLIVAQK